MTTQPNPINYKDLLNPNNPRIHSLLGFLHTNRFTDSYVYFENKDIVSYIYKQLESRYNRKNKANLTNSTTQTFQELIETLSKNQLPDIQKIKDDAMNKLNPPITKIQVNENNPDQLTFISETEEENIPLNTYNFIMKFIPDAIFYLTGYQSPIIIMKPLPNGLGQFQGLVMPMYKK